MKRISKILKLLSSFTLLFGTFGCEEVEEIIEKEIDERIEEKLQEMAYEDAEVEEGDAEETYKDATIIKLSSDSATINGKVIEESDYTWHCDPTEVHDDVKNAPAEYYTGTQITTTEAAYIDHELFYYPSLPTSSFKLVNYDGEQEWAYYYQDGTNNSFIFATLPHLGNSVPTDMMHTEEEAAENKVLHITEAGTYVLEGKWDGQIFVNLGDSDETFTDETAKVNIILNGAEIDCSVAPGIIFYSAYECDNTWEEKESWSNEVDTSNAGVNVTIADDSVNKVSGKNVYRMLKTKYKDETSTDEIKLQKKMRKTDAAFYSYVSMNINGEEDDSGKLYVSSGFEGVDSELHLTINGGYINITSEDDGSNVNEDYVSVWTLNGGTVVINASQGSEGDGVDSNGFITINGGTLYVNNVTSPDSACDSECGVYYNGGDIYIDNTKMTYSVGKYQELNGNGGGMGGMGGQGGGMTPPGQGGEGGQEGQTIPGFEQEEDFDIKEFKEKVAALDDDATLQDVLDLLGMGGQQGGQGGMSIPEQGGEMGQGQEMGQGGTTPPTPPTAK